MKPTLVILAAGMGSRYGGIKQMDSFGPSGETIIDYSIYDAIRCGFGKIVFIIRRDFADVFRDTFEKKLRGKVQTQYVMQEMDAYTGGFTPAAERTKPWGTAHAVLCSRDVVQEPFAVINADDFYGKDAFEKAAAFLQKDVSPRLWSIIGYQLSKTLSENGTVSRGVCQADAQHHLIGIVERVKIYPEEGRIVYEESGVKTALPPDTPVSMNFWCFHPEAYDYIDGLFKKFLADKGDNPKAEFFIPIVGDAFIKDGKGAIRVIETSAQWFGVTYKEDAPEVKASIQALIAAGVYPETLWS